MRSGLYKKTILMLLIAVLSIGVSGCGNTSGTPIDDNQVSEQAEPDDYSSQIFTMGTVFTVRAICDGSAQEAVIAADEILNSTDRLLSWRTKGSAAELFNKLHTADVSEIKDLIELSLEVSSESGGAFDMTILPLSQLWQFDKMEEEDFDPSEMTVPDPGRIKEAREKIDFTQLKYDDAGGILSTNNNNLQIELGAIGKGYAIDRALASMKDAGVSGAMISAGSSIGLSGTKADGEPFKIALRDPRGSISDYLGVLTLTDCSISTSGDYERYFEKDDVRYHHILDPHTGYPADSGLMQVTVIGGNGALCDALSTACFILGLDEGMRLAEKHNVMAIFVDNERKIWYNNSNIISIFELSSKGYKLYEYNRKEN